MCKIPSYTWEDGGWMWSWHWLARRDAKMLRQTVDLYYHWTNMGPFWMGNRYDIYSKQHSHYIKAHQWRGMGIRATVGQGGCLYLGTSSFFCFCKLPGLYTSPTLPKLWKLPVIDYRPCPKCLDTCKTIKVYQLFHGRIMRKNRGRSSTASALWPHCPKSLPMHLAFC